MKILIATPLYPPDIGGPAKYAKELRDEFERLGHTVKVVVYGSLERRLPIGLRHFVYFFRVLRNCKGIDHIFAFDTWSVGLPALLAAQLSGKKFLARIGGDFLWEAYVERTKELVKLSQFYLTPRHFSLKERVIRRGTAYLARHAHALLFNTLWQRDIWARPYQLNLARTHVVENMYEPAGKAQPAQGYVFVASGRTAVLKNVAFLAKVFAKVQQKHLEASLDTQPLPPQEHLARVAACYAVVVASVSEINPNTALEALALGKPFIAPQDCGVADRLKAVGLFVDTTNEAALQAALERMLEPAFYDEKLKASKEFSYTHSWSDIAREVLAVMQTI